jgi:hypothetical protein
MDESMARDQTVSGRPSGASKSLSGKEDLPDQLSTTPRSTRASSRKSGPTPQLILKQRKLLQRLYCVDKIATRLVRDRDFTIIG